MLNHHTDCIKTTAARVRPITEAAGKPLLSPETTAARRATILVSLSSCPHWHPSSGLQAAGDLGCRLLGYCVLWFGHVAAAGYVMAAGIILTALSETIESRKDAKLGLQRRLAAGPAAPAAGIVALRLLAVGWLRLRRLAQGLHAASPAAVAVVENTETVRASASGSSCGVGRTQVMHGCGRAHGLGGSLAMQLSHSPPVRPAQ